MMTATSDSAARIMRPSAIMRSVGVSSTSARPILSPRRSFTGNRSSGIWPSHRGTAESGSDSTVSNPLQARLSVRDEQEVFGRVPAGFFRQIAVKLSHHDYKGWQNIVVQRGDGFYLLGQYASPSQPYSSA